MSDAGRVVLESLRLDLDPEEAVRERAEVALALGVGGFIVFGGERRQVADLVAHLETRARRPLWIGADLERGAGQQFAGLPTLPPPAALAVHPDPDEAVREAAVITARGAKSVGVNLVFAPVLDLDVEPDNPIVGTRSFGDDPVTVAHLGAAWIDACQREGVVACAKHFPGHGRTIADSHLEVPVVTAPRGELQTDLLPFRRVAGQVGAILTAHVAYPGLGSGMPATLSRALLGDLLRGEMGFAGLVVTDAMNMAGFVEGADDDEHPAVAALLAGCDLLLYPDDTAATIDALEAAAGRDARVATRLEEAAERSEAVHGRFFGRGLGKLTMRARRAGFGLGIGAGAEADGDKGSEKGSDAGSEAGSEAGSSADAADGDDDSEGGAFPPADAEDALRAAAMSMRIVQRFGELPEWLRPGRPIRVLAVWDDREVSGRPRFGARFVAELLEQGWQAALADPEQPERIPTIVLVASTPQAWKGTAGLTPRAGELVERSLANPSGALAVVFGHRRLLEELGGTGVVAWGAELALERLAARKLVADVEAARG